MNTELSKKLLDESVRLMPGGVSSPVRAFKSVGAEPLFIERGEGPYVYDEDGNRFTDYVQSWGPLALGHAHPLVVEAVICAARKGTSFGASTKSENKLAQKIVDLFPSVEMVRFVSSGTEATMSAIRLARGVSKRDKIIKFSGGFHGHADMLLAQAGSGVMTFSLPDSKGVPKAATCDTLVAPYNDLEAVKKLFQENADQIGAVIIEPIAANMGFVLPKENFLTDLQTLCRANKALFILDEVMTGFRASFPGVQTNLNLQPDITCFGKVIGGGLPIAAYGGRRPIMENLAPVGEIYQSGTLSGNPLSTASGLATLEELEKPGVFEKISEQTKNLIDGVKKLASKHRIRIQANCRGTMFGIYFLNGSAPEVEMPVCNYEDAVKYVHTKRYAQFFCEMLKRKQYLAPSAFEAGFVSAAHTPSCIQSTLEAVDESLKNLG